MDKLDFIEGMKILSSCYQKDIGNDDFTIWYEMLKELNKDDYIKAVIEICKEKSFMPTVHDILDKTKVIKKKYLLAILEVMKKDGYFRKGYRLLGQEHEDRNYYKTIRWIENETAPMFLKDDIREYIRKQKTKNNIKLINQKNKIQIN